MGTGAPPDDAVPWLGAQVLERVLPPRAAKDAVGAALAALGAGEAVTPLRQVVAMPEGALFLMPAALGGTLAVKILNDRPTRPDGLTLPGVVVLFERTTGRPLCVLDGPTLTALRTAGIAAWATERLGRRRNRVALVGAGFQARYQVEGLLDLGGITTVTLYNRHRARAERLARDLAARHPDVAWAVADTVAAAVNGADVVTVVTRSTSPLLERWMLVPDVHINAMGAFRPTDRECAGDVIAGAAVFADTLEGVLAEAGDVVLPIRDGQLTASSVKALSQAPPTPPRGTRTVMKSVGAAVFDAAAADAAYQAWRQAPGRALDEDVSHDG